MQEKLSREEQDSNDRYQQRFGNDPVKDFRATLNGAPLFVDECFHIQPLDEQDLIALAKRLNLSMVEYKGRIIYTRGA